MERKQLEAAAAANHYLRGLLAMPLGVLLIAFALGNMEWGPFRHLWVVPVLLVLTGAAYLLITQYYNDNYGRVVLKKGQARTVAGTVVAIAVLVAVPMSVQALEWPLNGLGAAWGAVALGYYAVNVGLRPRHVAIWGSVLVASLAPVWGDPRTTDAPNVGLLLVGLACVVTGVLDHRILVGTFGSGDLDAADSDVRS